MAVIGAHMAIDVQKPHEMSALIDTQTRKLRAQLLGAMVRGEAGEPAAQRLHFRCSVEPKVCRSGRVRSLRCSGLLMRSSAMSSRVSNVVRRP